MIGRAVLEIAGAVDIKQANLGAASPIGVADHDHRVGGDQHLVVPRAVRIDVAGERVGDSHWSELVSTDADREEPPAAQDDKIVAVQFDDAALVYTRMLNVGD